MDRNSTTHVGRNYSSAAGRNVSRRSRYTRVAVSCGVCRGAASRTLRVLDSEPCMTICQRLIALDASVQRRNRILLPAPPCCWSVAAAPAYAQEVVPPARDNAVYVELLGNGGLYSVNYERALTPALRVRVGAGAWTAKLWGHAGGADADVPDDAADGSRRRRSPPGGRHRCPAGIPQSRTRCRRIGRVRVLIGLIGYRYQPPLRRFVFRAGFTPFYGFGDSSVAWPEEGFLPSLGFSFGARF